VLAQEHRIYPQAARWFLEGRLSLVPEGIVRVAGSAPQANALLVPEVDAARALQDA